MFYLKQYLSNSEKWDVSVLVKECSDLYSEFYITKDKLRIFIKENLDVLWNTLKRGDKLVFGEGTVGIITGFAERQIEVVDIKTNEKKIIPSRKYIAILSKGEENANRLLRYVAEKFRTIDLFAKVKKDDPTLKCFYSNGFVFLHGRGKELLLYKKADNRPEFIFRKFMDDKPEVKKRAK